MRAVRGIVIGASLGCVIALGGVGCKNEVPDRDMPGGILSGSDYQAIRMQARANQNAIALRNSEEAAKRNAPVMPTTMRAAPTSMPAGGAPASGPAGATPAASPPPAASSAPAAPSAPA